MTKRDYYVAVARIISGVKNKSEKQRLYYEFSTLFRTDSPDFDGERFHVAVFGTPRGRSGNRRSRPSRRA